MSQTTLRPTDLDRQRLHRLNKLGLKVRHIFDIGASIGRWSSRVSQDFPDASFDMFEPLIDHAPAYREKMATTLARHPGFRLHKVALGSELKRTRMYLYPENLVGSTALPLDATPRDAVCIDVEMLTLDYVIQEFRLPVPQVIKMDVQGCELSVLQGARRMLPEVDVLLLECWLTRAYGSPTPLWQEVVDWLRGFDIHLWDLGNGWRDTDGTLVAQDCFFMNARCPLSRLQSEYVSRSERGDKAHLPPKAQEFWLKRMRHFLCGYS